MLTLAAVLVAAGVILLRSGNAPKVNVGFADVSRGPIMREVLTSGTLEPTNEVEAGAQVSGTVQSLFADFNQRVKAGEIIAQLDPSTFDAAVAQARAKVIQADADAEQRQVVLNDARVKADRARELQTNDLITRAELDTAVLAAKQAEADLASARASAKAARAMLRQAEVDRNHTLIRSPIDGIVVSRNVEVGQTLASRFEAPVLFRIADLRKMQMLTDVSESEVGGVRAGTKVNFQIESIGPRQFTGTIAEVRLQPVLETPTGTSGNSSQGRSTTSTTGGSAAAAAATTAPSTTGTTGASTPTSTSTTAATSTSTPSTTVAAAPAGSVVSYTAIVDVDNSDLSIAPGNTAIVVLPTARRDDVMRVSNNALSFRPSPAVLEATNQKSLNVSPPTSNDDAGQGRAGYVWKFENGKFVPIEVRTGIADEAWTEILSGPIQPGDRLVTSATTAR
jgi:RND family efflux transporter MFP subunit